MLSDHYNANLLKLYQSMNQVADSHKVPLIFSEPMKVSVSSYP